MAKKAIATVLLLVLTAWAEMTLAPMLAMHAGHMRPGHEMAADMPMPHAAHHHGDQQATSKGRPCCPTLHQPDDANLLELVSDAPPCGDPHNCCFSQGPQSVPAPVTVRPTHQIAPTEMAALSQVPAPAPQDSRATTISTGPPPSLFGTILRV